MTSMKEKKINELKAELTSPVIESDDDVGCCQIFLNGGVINFPNISRKECKKKLIQQGGSSMGFITNGNCPP